MFGGGVTLLRGAALRASLGVFAGVILGVGTPTAAAVTGGADLPGGGSSPPPAVVPEPAATEPATQVALTPPSPALPVLATQSRRPEDPIAQDLAALIEPSPVAAVAGHVVYTRPHMGRTELIDAGGTGDPRILVSGTRAFGAPSAGLGPGDAPVAVLSTCAGVDAVVYGRQAPKCPLRAVDLTTGTSRALGATTGALLGDLSADTLAFTRRGGTGGVRLYLATGGAAAKAIALPTLGKVGDGWLPTHGVPIPGSVQITALDVDDTGRIAAVIEYRSKQPVHSSSLWLRSAAGVWSRLATLGTHVAGQGTRQILAPQLDETGVRAYVEGIVETPSFAGHWSDAGAATAKVSVRRSIGRATILHSAAYDGDRLVFVDWLPGVPCGSEGALACGLRALGPVAVG